jgi:hypothetical protein
VGELDKYPLKGDFLCLYYQAGIPSDPGVHLNYLGLTGTEGKGDGKGCVVLGHGVGVVIRLIKKWEPTLLRRLLFRIRNFLQERA